MKKGYVIIITALVIVCLIQAFTLMKVARAEKAVSRDAVSDFIGSVQKDQRVMQDDFNRFFNDDFFKNSDDPFKEMENIRKRMRSMMISHTENAFDDSWDTWFKGRFGGPEITVTTEDAKDSVVMRVHVPGLEKNNLDVNIDKDRVKIECDVREVRDEQDNKGKRVAHYSSQQHMTRIFSLPQDVDASKAVTKQDKDEITITLPKKTAKTKV